MRSICVYIGILFLLNSCYQEAVIPEVSGEVFEITVSPEMQETLYTSKDISYTIDDPELSLSFDGLPLDLKEMRIRGRSSLDYKRKSFSVFLDHPFAIAGRDGNTYKVLSRFKLISLCMDYTYINNRIAFGILEHSEVMPLFYKYVEVIMNGETQGVYLLVEDPERFAEDQGSEYILRRGYHNAKDDEEYKPRLYFKSIEAYASRFDELYDQLPNLEGKELYNFLDQRLDLNQYFRKMGIDFLLKNGDYTDEVYFYSTIREDQIRFQVIPWDYDDIFSRYPHEVGRDWAVGKVFGARSYVRTQDVLDVIGNKLIYSIEDDLDYAICLDSFTYARYELALADLINDLDGEVIDNLFTRVEQELSPFYDNEEIILQSHFDLDSTNLELWRNNMEEKHVILGERFNFMKNYLYSLDQ